jgi:hypothetical protein
MNTATANRTSDRCTVMQWDDKQSQNVPCRRFRFRTNAERFIAAHPGLRLTVFPLPGWYRSTMSR